MSTLRVGKVPGVTPTRWQRVWAERFPRVALEMADVEVAAQRASLLDGTVDMCFARLPIDREGLHAIPLYEEVPVVWLSKDHVLAELDELSTSDLVDERVLDEASGESIELVACSAAVLCVPMSIARSGSRRDLVHRPLTDGEPTTIALVWRVADENPLLEEFIGIVRGRTPNSSRSRRERGSDAQPGHSPQPGKPRRGGEPQRRGRR